VFAWACGHTRVDGLGGPQYLNQDTSWLVTDLIFNSVCVEGCSGYQARLAGDQQEEKRRMAACLRSYPRLLWLHSRSMREDDEAKEMLGDEVEARYLTEQKTAKQ